MQPVGMWENIENRTESRLLYKFNVNVNSVNQAPIRNLEWMIELYRVIFTTIKRMCSVWTSPQKEK